MFELVSSFSDITAHRKYTKYSSHGVLRTNDLHTIKPL